MLPARGAPQPPMAVVVILVLVLVLLVLVLVVVILVLLVLVLIVVVILILVLLLVVVVVVVVILVLMVTPPVRRNGYPTGYSKQLRCFFCKHGFTHGIAHKKKHQKRNTPSTARTACTAERVNLNYPGKCFICMNELQATGMSRGEARKKARSSRLGCGTCEGQKKFCCEEHWHLHGV